MIGDLDVEIPDVAEPIEAWRAFLLRGDAATPILSSMNGIYWPPYGTGKRRWHPTEFVTARCTLFDPGLHAKEVPPHDCPSPIVLDHIHAGKGCGIYGYKTLEALAWDFPLRGIERKNINAATPRLDSLMLWGKVQLWGNVFDHELGYRAQYGKVKSLVDLPGYGIITRKSLDWIAEFYGVPVEEIDVSNVVKIKTNHTERAVTDPNSQDVFGLLNLLAAGFMKLVKQEVKSKFKGKDN